MSVTAPETEARVALMTILNAEFSPLVSESDKLHASLGYNGTRIGVYPVRARPMQNNMLVQDSEIVVQFYGEWDKQIDNEQSVDPAIIETFAERFRRRLKSTSATAGTGRVWYFNITNLEYPDDPTGNKTRFEATVVAKGNNSSLVETTG